MHSNECDPTFKLAMAKSWGATLLKTHHALHLIDAQTTMSLNDTNSYIGSSPIEKIKDMTAFYHGGDIKPMDLSMDLLDEYYEEEDVPMATHELSFELAQVAITTDNLGQQDSTLTAPATIQSIVSTEYAIDQIGFQATTVITDILSQALAQEYGSITDVDSRLAQQYTVDGNFDTYFYRIKGSSGHVKYRPNGYWTLENAEIAAFYGPKARTFMEQRGETYTNVPKRVLWSLYAPVKFCSGKVQATIVSEVDNILEPTLSEADPDPNPGEQSAAQFGSSVPDWTDWPYKTSGAATPGVVYNGYSFFDDHMPSRYQLKHGFITQQIVNSKPNLVKTDHDQTTSTD